MLAKFSAAKKMKFGDYDKFSDVFFTMAKLFHSQIVF